jgi:hypothetical protein
MADARKIEAQQYATEFRYPADVMEPKRQESEQAIASAQAAIEFVRVVLSVEMGDDS